MKTKWNAEVRHQSARPQDDDRITYVGVEAPNAIAAAQIVADAAAMRRYGDDDEDGERVMGDAMACFLQADRNAPDTYRAFIGQFAIAEGWGRTTGTSITIRLTEAPLQ